MTFVRKFNGKTERPDNNDRIVAVYTCPEHGEFDAEVQRDANGEAPDSVPCPEIITMTSKTHDCRCESYWTPSSVACRVRRVEAVKGRWEKPERETFLDTRDLAEGMDVEDWQAKRAAIWEKKRQEDVMAVKKGFG